jgi:hypothetical protein
MDKTKKINIAGTEITIFSKKADDYISLTDMAKSQLQEVVIIKWLSLKSTIEYLGEWEALYNPNFNYTEFGTIRNEAGSNNFVLSVKNWREATNAHYDILSALRSKEITPFPTTTPNLPASV